MYICSCFNFHILICLQGGEPGSICQIEALLKFARYLAKQKVGGEGNGEIEREGGRQRQRQRQRERVCLTIMFNTCTYRNL